jgi:hypothetical protein
MVQKVNYSAAIAPGDTITIVFDGATSDLVCKYQRLADNGNTVICTLPTTDDPVTTTLYVDDFQYLYEGTPPVPPTASIEALTGSNVTVQFSNLENEDLTGTLVASDADTGIVVVNDGANDYICKDYWSIKIN